MPYPRAIEWVGGPDGYLRLLDQTRLPAAAAYRDCRLVEEVWEAIRALQVRGAPAIGIAAAFGVVLGLRHSSLDPLAAVRAAAQRLRTSRPTAINLFWALDRMEQAAAAHGSSATLAERLLAEAQAIFAEDLARCHAIGEAGARIIENGKGVLTHCNAGALAASDHGTALAAIFRAWEQGKRFTVFVDETRPLFQGARLTAWELAQRGIDAVLICDSMAAQVMKEGRVACVIVGADRIAANGDTANKIGTYGVALAARAHGIPFYVAAPSSTFDLTLADGSLIPIEERAASEVSQPFGRVVAPEGIRVYNPAFDVTPAGLITGIITEKGLIAPVNQTALRDQLGGP